MKKIDSLREKIKAGTATPEEEREFDLLADQIAAEEWGRNSIDSDELERNVESFFGRIRKDRTGKHVLTKRIFRPTWLAAAASVVILAIAGAYIFKGYLLNDQVEIAAREPIILQGASYEVLPDGTTVILKAGSTISYSDDFGSQDRVVELTGQGYFDVKHDPAHPFKVKTGELTTTVLGTAFNIKAYVEDNDVVITVTRGRVAVSDSSRELAEIIPNQQLVFNKTSNEAVASEVVAEKALAWTREYLIFDNVTVEEAVRQVAERFNKRMKFADNNVKACVINVAFVKGEDLETIMTVLSSVTQARYRIENNVVTIEGGKSCSN